MFHEAVVAMRAGAGQVSDITVTSHVLPTLNEGVGYAFDDVDVE